MTVVATHTAEKRIRTSLQRIEGIESDFRTCEILPSENYALPEDKSGFRSEEEWERAKALCENLGSKIDRRRPLGYGGMGLLVVFPTNVPNNTIPIFRSHSRSATEVKWMPLFERFSH
jgi:hypothetical protein